MKLNEKLYNLRKAKSLSQEELAYKLGVTRQTISKWETGDSKPDIEKILPICEVYNITPDNLLNEAEISSKNSPAIETKMNKKRALMLVISIFMYFLSIIVLTITEELDYNEIIGVCGFLTLCGIATSILIYLGVTSKENKIRKKEKPMVEQKAKIVTEIVELVFLILYLVISFVTMAWHITWIIWIIDGIIEEIIKLIFLIGDDNDE